MRIKLIFQKVTSIDKNPDKNLLVTKVDPVAIYRANCKLLQRDTV